MNSESKFYDISGPGKSKYYVRKDSIVSIEEVDVLYRCKITLITGKEIVSEIAFAQACKDLGV